MPKSYRLGNRSLAKLASVHIDLQMVVRLAIRRTPYDFAIIHGWRNATAQTVLYESGASTKNWPHSTHNQSKDHRLPEEVRIATSDAIDFAPYIGGSIPWKDSNVFACVAGVILSCGEELGVKLRWGADWDNDGNTLEHSLLDLGHIEVIHK